MGVAKEVLDRIAAEFPPEQFELVRVALDQIIDIRFPNSPMTRVQLDVLTLANGDLAELKRMVDAANVDWRDVLYWVDYPSDAPKSWGEVKEKLSPHLPPGTLQDPTS